MVIENEHRLGIGIALLDRFTTQTLPRAIDLKNKVDAGECLDQWDIDFLRELLQRTQEVQPFVSDNPVSQGLYSQAVTLYREIAAKGLANEEKA
jgi:hypothetical protein